MRNVRFSQGIRRFVAAAVIGLALALAVGTPAGAQTQITSSKPTLVSVRADLLFSTDSVVENNLGKILYGAGMDYNLSQKNLTKTALSVDYIERSSGGFLDRIIPVTVDEFITEPSSGGTTVYYGLGGGAYFVHSVLPNHIGFTTSSNGVGWGGFLAAGLNFPQNIFLEARYHFVQKVGVSSPSGLQVSLGYRF